MYIFYRQYLTFLFFLIICNNFSIWGQGDIDISVGTDIHLASSLLPPHNFFGKEELRQIFAKDFSGLSPELNFNFSKSFGKHQLGLGGAFIFYKRILSISLPVMISYSFDWLAEDKTPFVHLRLGHSFFITEGTLVSFGVGYKLNRFRIHLLYHNQEKKYASLEQNRFVSSRLASFSLGLKYNFRLISLR